MIPILYEKTETSFTTNGLGRLRDIVRCECIEERNGIFEVEFDYPVSGEKFGKIIAGRYIGVKHNENGDVQPFEIYAYSKPIDGIVTFKAYHISYKQSKMTVANGIGVNSITDAFTMLSGATPSNPFTYWTDISSTNYMSGALGEPKTVRQLLGGVKGSILDTYGGEYEWDKWTVKLWAHRGQTRNFTIRYGVNMTGYQDDSDYSGTYNAVIPYWKGQNVEGNEIVVKSAMVSSGQSMYDESTACIPLDLTDKFEEQPSVADVQAMATAYLNDNTPATPSQNIKVDFIRLQDSEEYEDYSALQYCNLCDSIRVIFPRYGINNYFKIVKTVYDVLLERYTEMELGTLSTTLADAIGTNIESSSSNSPSGVIETGADSVWRWRKWANGTAECWGWKSGTNAANAWTQWGSLYYSTQISELTYPNGLFVETPYSVSELSGVTADCWLAKSSAVERNGTPKFYLMRPSNVNVAVNYSISVYACGRWK